MIWAYFGFYYVDALPFTQLSQYFSYCYFLFLIEDFSSIFRSKHYMVFAIPFRMR